MYRPILSILAMLASFPVLAADPDLSSPPAALRSYLAATRANDLETARKCWVVDDGNATGAIDVLVGMWISSRKLVSATEARFGAEGLKLLGRWNRPHCSDRAIDLTLDRIGTPDVRERSGIARFRIQWQPGDGESAPAFLHGSAPIFFRLVGEQWKLDANIFMNTERAADLFQPGQIWPILRDEMQVMNELVALLEKGNVRTVSTFEKELQTRVQALRAKYQR